MILSRSLPSPTLFDLGEEGEDGVEEDRDVDEEDDEVSSTGMARLDFPFVSFPETEGSKEKREGARGRFIVESPSPSVSEAALGKVRISAVRVRFEGDANEGVF